METDANSDTRRRRPCTGFIKIVSYATHAFGLLFALGSSIAASYLLGTEGRQHSCHGDEEGLSVTAVFSFTGVWIGRCIMELVRSGVFHTASAWARCRSTEFPRVNRVLNVLYIFIKIIDFSLFICGIVFYILINVNDNSCAVRSLPRLVALLQVIFVYIWLAVCTLIVLILCAIFIICHFLSRHRDDGDSNNRPVTETIVNQVTRLVTGEDISSDTDANASDSEQEGPACTICLSALRGADAGALRRLGCGHTFHSDCIMQHLTQHSATCPLCRQNIEEARDLRSDHAMTDVQNPC